jgi:hypothetical protein
MIYVFDTSAFITLKHFYPSAFPSLWAGLEKLIRAAHVVSVREVLNELTNYNDADFIQEWAKDHKQIFPTPMQAELLCVKQIFAVAHFQPLISNKALLKGTPVADPFVIASAMARQSVGTVVTQEQLKPTASKIPNVCNHFKVPCLNLEEFMVAQKWAF